ncbi:efflux RND transporter periplasmic adaptor subunit [Rhodospirillum rubrum]|uniref:Secretion protein HlyD n=1 Tax=Rhodospirillum rubrum (strain ATCC 11170 / ATH 1.1.1 / DSM 467 / LMG 4362 / NCIMB 8255 / S1) TaxID=269796 RepID=Q2RQ70_RHORT|nr:efflux RND transporter periplasmic adaptor subunit [Rhodospirillum rubrum]ABC23725.1 Secretion protein HlyD [Rhodospirillum rubrum ATCC 11170]AEO49464.1 secretion protein HlyD [Rhodospirillum rubrum F11]MBK5955401.1 secretion protein HlyD [Rhodospirillum rubrum]QXG79681.1 efflux RND transporter periplasmic adaptor subunit [Rhodospirillum rubrum]HAP98917.1 efflux RND transporter periplasmic adaptor subunit [Rhodospirillum rubrum]
MNKRFLISAALLSVAAYAGSSFLHSETPPPAKPASEILSVTVTAPREETVVERVGTTGTLVPREEIVVMAEVSNARILSLAAEVGDQVQKGQKLAVLDTESLLLQVAQMEAEYTKARDEFVRVDSIKESGAVSKSLRIEKKTALDTMTAKLQEAKLAVRRTVITAPASGTVYERRAVVGGLSSQGDPLFRIAGKGEIEADLRVPEGVAGRVSVGQAVRLSLPGLKAPLTGTVRLVAPRIDASDRSASVRVSVLTGQALMVGAFVHADIDLGEVTGLAVPTTAIQRDSEGAFMWTVKGDGGVARLAVTPLLERDGLTLVGDVSPDLRVVARAGGLVRAGDIVKTLEAR